MDVIDVRGLPDPVAHALQAMVQALRDQLRTTRDQRQRVDLPAWPGKPIGKLTREEIYDDVRA
jgi:hypothetical protein